MTSRKQSASERELALGKIIDIYLCVRVLREWEKGSAARAQLLGEKEVMALVVLEQCGGRNILEKELGITLALAPSSTSDLVQKLGSLGLIQREQHGDEGGRWKPLILTERGKAALTNVRRGLVKRYAYLADALAPDFLPPGAMDSILAVLDDMQETVLDRVQEQIFSGEPVIPEQEPTTKKEHRNKPDRR